MEPSKNGEYTQQHRVVYIYKSGDKLDQNIYWWERMYTLTATMQVRGKSYKPLLADISNYVNVLGLGFELIYSVYLNTICVYWK